MFYRERESLPTMHFILRAHIKKILDNAIVKTLLGEDML